MVLKGSSLALLVGIAPSIAAGLETTIAVLRSPSTANIFPPSGEPEIETVASMATCSYFFSDRGTQSLVVEVVVVEEEGSSSDANYGEEEVAVEVEVASDHIREHALVDRDPVQMMAFDLILA